jgi:RHS repeat-associated protein
MTYDRYGNRTAQSIASGCTGITCPTNSVTISATTNRLSGSPYAYDLNGNMTNDGQNTLVYDAENRALSATNGSASGTYTYDGSNLRVEKVSGSTTTVYLFSGSKVIAEYVNGALPSAPTREYIYSGGALLAKIESGATNYYHQDLLSNRLVTDSSGNTVAQMGHFPFGESWYNATSDKLLFTTYERDAESGNDYAMARYNVSRLGRFSSPDPLPGSIADSQSLNRYLYTENNPISATDPSGAVTYMCTRARDEDCPYRNYGGFVFGSTWDEFDILFTPTGSEMQQVDTSNCPNGDCSPWQEVPIYGNIGLLGLFGGGPEGPGFLGGVGGGNARNFVNQKVLAKCIQDLFGVTLTQFVESKPGSNGLFVGYGPDTITNGGNDRSFTVTNSLAFSRDQLTAMANQNAPVQLPQGWVNGLTYANAPYINYTAYNATRPLE